MEIINTEKADEIEDTNSSLQESDEIVCSYICETHEVLHDHDDSFSKNESESVGKDEDPLFIQLVLFGFQRVYCF